MPIVLVTNGFRFFFFSGEYGEPPHRHVEYGDKAGKYWLDPVELARVRALVIENRILFLEKWHVHFGNPA